LEAQLFTDQIGRDLRWKTFLQTELGQLHQAIPFSELEELFPTTNKGRPSLMSIRGGIALQILKSYLGLSDAKLIARINSDWVLQFFCGIRLKEGSWIKDKDYVGRWRRFLAKHIDYDVFQKTLAQHWQPQMENTNVVMMDATCYESHLRYPTDVKLLWESCEQIWKLIDGRCKSLKLPKIRRKQKSISRAYNHYQKYKRKPRALTKKIKRRLLYLLQKGIKKWNDLSFKHPLKLTQKTFELVENIRVVYFQQQTKFDNPDAKIKNRIVSLYKPYIRPIVRGKEIKKTEFGAKVHSFQIDGITFIEHFSFDAFNEGVRLKSTVALAESYFDRCTQLGADRIYANNENRRFCGRYGIKTNFVRKGRRPKQPTPADQLRGLLASIRASSMEGSFGNEKLHYNLLKIKAKTEATEKLWICFGIWTASAMKIARRRNERTSIQLAA
jgi:hypothetical protein